MICQLTNIEFVGRGKNHPALRAVLDDAFRNGTRPAVLDAIQAAKLRGVSTIEEFVQIAMNAETAGCAANKEEHKAAVEAETARRTAWRKRDEQNRKLRAAGFRWVKTGDFAAGMFEENFEDDGWQLFDADGNEVTVEQALAVI